MLFECRYSTSDFHNIIGCSLKTNKPKPNKKIIQYRSFKHFDEDKFHKDLKELPIHSVICSGDVDHQLSLFYTMYSDVVDKHIPLKRKTINKSPAPFMNGVLRKAIYIKCTLRNRYYKNRSTENWHRYRSQRNLVTKLRKQSIRGYFKKKCEGDVNRNDFWKTIKPFISNKNCVQGDNIILREGSDIVTDQQEVCNVFNDFFTNVATNIGFQDMIPTDISKDNLVQHVMDKHAQHPGVIHIQECISNNTFAFHHITDDDVLKILNNIDIKKATGYDNLSPRIVKMSAQYIVTFLTHLINKCIDESVFPAQLKNAEISAIYKKIDKLNKENYRPVSILVMLSKVLEKVYSRQIETYFANIFNSLLSAYRKGYGTNDVLLKFSEDWKEALDNNMYVCALLMDLSKAFDCIPHSLMIAKLSAYGFSEQACLLVASYLSERKQRVKLGNARSSWSNINKGVPQGSILGPILFNVFLHDLYYHIETCKLFNYADDNTLFHSSYHMNTLLAAVKRDAEVAVIWFENNGMKANPGKFQLIVSHRRLKQDVTLNICNIEIKSTACVKLLGITFDDDLKFDFQVNEICKRAAKQLNVLRRFANILNENNKMLIFQCFILSQFRYCPLIWHFCKKGKVKQMEKIQERALRFVFNDINSNYIDLLCKSKRSSLFVERQRMICIQVYKIVNGICPSYLHDLLETKETTYSLRDPYLLIQPRVNTVKHGLLSFRYHGAKIWNGLPANIKSASSIKVFKQLINAWSDTLCSCSFCSNNV